MVFLFIIIIKELLLLLLHTIMSLQILCRFISR